MEYRFTKADRIRKRKDFLRLAQTGRRIQNRYFIINADHGSYPQSRLGVTVTKRVGKAAKRNRIKRLCREYFRLNRNGLPIPLDINIIAKREAVAVPAPLLFEALRHLFAKLNHVYR